jgi:hypothetical protein
VREAQRGVAGDGAAAIEDLGDAVGGNAELAGELGGADGEFVEFLGQMLAWVDGFHSASLTFQ